MHKCKVNLAILTLFIGLSGATCVQEVTNKPRTPGLRGFGSAEELRAYMAQQVQESTAPRNAGFPPLFGITPSPTMGAMEDNSATGGSGGPGYSTTNIQEAGVDESDVVKNDGNIICVLDGNIVHVVRANAASPSEAAHVTVDGTGDSMYLQGNYLAVLSRRDSWVYYAQPTFGAPGMPVAVDLPTSSAGSGNSGSPGSVDPAPPVGDSIDSGDLIVPPIPENLPPAAFVTVFDVSDPANPRRLGGVTLDGTLADSRLIGTKLHVIVTSWPVLPPNPTPAALESMTLDEWVPDATVTAADGSVVRSGDVAEWQDFFRPIDPDGYGITTAVTLDISDPTAPFTSTALSANAGTVYASPEALYITDTQYPVSGAGVREDTMIHKLEFTETGTDYVASGLVAGRPLNQYSLGEHEGYLRIATHVSVFNSSGSTQANNVYVLGQAGESLAVVGSIEDIAPGEQIYAARFVGERGFLVTFRRVDPLFTLDLSDPTQPRVAGELKVPGYSDHIQLLDENHLLTIGKDAEDAGTFAWIQGVQLSIFDVTDPSNPTILHKEVIGGRGTNSEANYNPKAFNYYAPLSALAFPVDLYGGDTTGAEYGQRSFTGLYVYDVTVADGFQLLGRISAGDSLQQGCFGGYYGFTRGVFIGDNVYSVTEDGVKAAAMADVNTVLGEVTFSTGATPSHQCYPVFPLPAGEGIR